MSKNQTSKGMWTCKLCTYERTPNHEHVCGVCEAPRPGSEPRKQPSERQEEAVEVIDLAGDDVGSSKPEAGFDDDDDDDEVELVS